MSWSLALSYNTVSCRQFGSNTSPLLPQQWFPMTCIELSEQWIQDKNREWGKGHFSKWKWPFSHSRFGHFQCLKRKSKTTSEYKHTPNLWEIWPQHPLLTTGKSFFSWGKVRKTQFSQNPLMGGFWSLGIQFYTYIYALFWVWSNPYETFGQ